MRRFAITAAVMLVLATGVWALGSFAPDADATVTLNGEWTLEYSEDVDSTVHTIDGTTSFRYTFDTTAATMTRAIYHYDELQGSDSWAYTTQPNGDISFSGTKSGGGLATATLSYTVTASTLDLTVVSMAGSGPQSLDAPYDSSGSAPSSTTRAAPLKMHLVR